MASVAIKILIVGTVASMIVSWVLLRWHKRNPPGEPLSAPSGESIPFLKVVAPVWLVLQLASETAFFLLTASVFAFAAGMLAIEFGGVGALIAIALAVAIFVGAVALLRARWKVGKRLYRQPETVPRHLMLWWLAPGLVTVPAATIALVAVKIFDHGF